MLLFFVLILALIFCVGVLVYILWNYRQGDSTHPSMVELKSLAAKIDPEYENLDLRAADIATTLKKKKILLCVDDPETGRPYSQNTLMGVLIHELAHFESESYGIDPDDHNDEWHENYNNIINRAIKVGVYDPKFPPPDNYCRVV